MGEEVPHGGVVWGRERRDTVRKTIEEEEGEAVGGDN